LYSRLWPEAEDRALRGRNPSAVFRTLYRQAGRLPNELPSCALPWRVETQCDKSTPPIFLSPEISQRIVRKSLFSNKQTFKQNTPSDCPFSRGKPTIRQEPLGRTWKATEAYGKFQPVRFAAMNT